MAFCTGKELDAIRKKLAEEEAVLRAKFVEGAEAKYLGLSDSVVLKQKVQQDLWLVETIQSGCDPYTFHAYEWQLTIID